MSSIEVNTLKLRTVRADDVSFAPYGALVKRPENATATLAAGAVESWSLPFVSGSQPQVMFNRYYDKGRNFSVMERHLQVTQCFFPLGNVPYIMVVGLGSEPGVAVKPEDIRAFYVEGNHGVLLWRNVWHSLARFPVGCDYIDLAFITDCQTQSEIEHHLAGGKVPQSTDFIDFEKTHQTNFLVANLNG